MHRSAHKGRQASQWLAARPETGQSATQFALNSLRRGELRLNSGVARTVTTGRSNSEPCSA
jgi:hypothetical protein